MLAMRSQTPVKVASQPSFTPLLPRLLQRKCACGGSTRLGGVCPDCQKKKLMGKPVQPKLRINQPGDAYEQEADRVAEQVVRMPAREVGTRQHDGVAGPPIQRRLMESADGVAEAPPMVHEVLSSPGQPLDPATRAFFEPRFRHDFSQVRVHADSHAAESARAVDARAYTAGPHIVFDADKYAPRTSEGKSLLGHELTHVLQQSAAGSAELRRQPKGGEKEKPGEPPANLVSCKDRLPLVQDAIKQAEALAKRALYAFERDYPESHEVSAMKAHFGSLVSDQKATIVERYKHVIANLGAKRYTCAKENKEVREENEVRDLCGQAACPGNAITLFPVFGSATCPAGPVMLHEAIHNAGACDDINKGGENYPPSRSEDNAYSYEFFAMDVMAGFKAPDLGKRKPTAPKVRP